MRDHPLRIRFPGFPAALCLFALLGTASCGADAADKDADSRGPQDRSPLAEVEGHVISRSEFAAFVRLSGGSDVLTLNSRERIEMFERMLIDHLIELRAEAENVSPSSAEIEEAVGRWLPQVEDKSSAEPLARRFLKAQKLLRSHIYADIAVTPQDTRAYYNKHYKSFEAGDRVHLLEILVKDRAQAESLREQLKLSDMRAFREAARLYSQGAGAASGGNLGIVERGALPAEFEEVVFDLKPGEVSEVFASGHGYHLFMVEETIPRHQQKYYEVQREIYVKLLAQKERRALDEFLKQLIRDASISIYDEELRMEWRKRHAETRS